MRIIGGKFSGRKILDPLDQNTRPLKDLVRGSIFNILEHSKLQKVILKDSNILDLFSGVGSFGIECISRGASSVIFFENHKNSLNVLRKNIELLNCKKKAKIFQEDVFRISMMKNFLKKKFDLIFLDPPFIQENINLLIDDIYKMKILNKRGIIILHRNKKGHEEYTPNFKISREENYGLSKIIFGSFN